MPSINIKNYFLGVVTRKNILFYRRKDYVLITSEAKKLWGYSGVLLTNAQCPQVWLLKTPVLFGIKVDAISHLHEGDLVLVDSSGNIRLLWDLSASDNCILMTESCNCRCLTCPQPPKRHNEHYFSIASRTLQLLDAIHVKKICLTGGEPTLYEEEFLAILKICKQKFPHASVIVLTNGKSLANLDFAKKISSIGLKTLLFCISLHADVDTIHDSIVGAKGSFAKTVAGIQNLGRLNQPIEIRFVISKMNHNRMESFSNFISRNFPFVVHIAFMGLEITGLAVNNYASIWIDPTDYQSELSVAVKDLNRKSINTSIYNIPFCLLCEESWEFARQSISGWKNSLLPVCRGCKLSEVCCGIFTTSGAFQSPNIHPLLEATTLCSCHENIIQFSQKDLI